MTTKTEHNLSWTGVNILEKGLIYIFFRVCLSSTTIFLGVDDPDNQDATKTAPKFMQIKVD